MKKYFVLLLVWFTCFIYGAEESNVSLPLNFSIAHCYANKETPEAWNEYKLKCEELLKSTEYKKLIISELNGQNYIAGPCTVVEKILSVIVKRSQSQANKSRMFLSLIEYDILRLSVETGLFASCKPLFVYNTYNLTLVKKFLKLCKETDARSRK